MTAAPHGHPLVRMGLGVAGLATSLAPLRRDTVAHGEQRVFRAVNDLPDSLHRPAWIVMQLGTVGAAPVAAAIAYAAGERRLAARLLAGGVGTWAASKVIKPVTGRRRPIALLSDTNVRGREAVGLGYPSGHAGVAVALGVAAFPRLGRRGRAAVVAAVPVVGLSRMYVGAHLPLDVMGGAALGLVVDAIVEVSTNRR